MPMPEPYGQFILGKKTHEGGNDEYGNAWIRQVLDDNVDLRPEVRNGLSMVLIYALSTAKATQLTDIDMFGILQDNDTGLGIVNKTSLKIYNDPYNYFNFLKSCMSGLIDAEELMAFLQLKTALVGMFNRGDHLVARSNIQHVSHVWQQRHKNIRNRRFATAVAIMSAPPPPVMTAGPGGGGFDPIAPLAGRLPNSYATEDYTSSTAVKYSILPHFSASNSGGVIMSPTAAATQSTQGADSHEQSGGGLSSLAAVSAGVLERGAKLSSEKVSPVSATSSYQSSASRPVANGGLSGTPRLHSTMSSSNTLNSSLIPSQLQIPSDSYYSQPSAKSFRSSFGATPHSGAGAGGMNQIGGRSFPSVPAMRFERVGAKEWDCKESKIYNIESLVLHNSSVFCLVDESRLSAEERAQKKVTSLSTGFVSLHAELQQRGALVTSWPKTDHNHMLDFLEGWLSHETEVPLTDFWLHHSAGGSSDLRNAATMGKGLIVYESVMQVGIVLRRNEALGIMEDCWRLIYPRDLEAETLTVTLGAFLASFFPQLRSVFARLGGGGGDLGNVVVKYYPQKIDPPVTQAPRIAISSFYQTIGTLDEPCINIISR
eukprot:gene22610-28746_t